MYNLLSFDVCTIQHITITIRLVNIPVTPEFPHAPCLSPPTLHSTNPTHCQSNY